MAFGDRQNARSPRWSITEAYGKKAGKKARNKPTLVPVHTENYCVSRKCCLCKNVRSMTEGSLSMLRLYYS